jgi:hypothetical protein
MPRIIGLHDDGFGQTVAVNIGKAGGDVSEYPAFNHHLMDSSTAAPCHPRIGAIDNQKSGPFWNFTNYIMAIDRNIAPRRKANSFDPAPVSGHASLKGLCGRRKNLRRGKHQRCRRAAHQICFSGI